MNAGNGELTVLMLQELQGRVVMGLSLWLSPGAMRMMRITASGSSTQGVGEEISARIGGQIRSSHFIRSLLKPMKRCARVADKVTQSEL